MWHELSVRSRYPEQAEELLLEHGAASVTLMDAADDPVLEPPPGSTPLWPSTEVRGLFAEGVDLELVQLALRARLPEGDALECTTRRVEDQDWIKAWLQYAQPLRFGPQECAGLWVCPSGHVVDEIGATVVHLDPGLAFGTGSHPSTALCLEWLATHRPLGARVLDYGCGSGILAIAALKLGAVQASAVDIDPQALTATAENAANNGVADRLTCATVEQVCGKPVDGPVDEAMDLVLANILARPLIDLAEALVRAVKPGGRIVLAGLLDTQADDVKAAYAGWCDFADDGRREGWTRIEARKRSRVGGTENP